MEWLKQTVTGMSEGGSPRMVITLAAGFVCALWAVTLVCWSAARAVMARRNKARRERSPANGGTHARSRHSFSDTREIEYNQPMAARFDNAGQFDTFVLQCTDRGVYIAPPPSWRGRREAPGGDRVHVTFWRRHDARYEFTSRLVSDGDNGHGNLVLEHAPLKRLQERRHVRVRCHREAELAPGSRSQVQQWAREGTSPQRAIPVMLRDISLGGASLTCTMELPRDAWLLIRLKVEGELSSMPFIGRVVRSSRLSGTSVPSHMISILFHDLTQRQEQLLSVFVVDLQRGALRRIIRQTGRQPTSSTPVRSRPSPEAVSPSAEKIASAPLSRTGASDAQQNEDALKTGSAASGRRTASPDKDPARVLHTGQPDANKQEPVSSRQG